MRGFLRPRSTGLVSPDGSRAGPAPPIHLGARFSHSWPARQRGYRLAASLSTFRWRRFRPCRLRARHRALRQSGCHRTPPTPTCPRLPSCRCSTGLTPLRAPASPPKLKWSPSVSMTTSRCWQDHYERPCTGTDCWSSRRSSAVVIDGRVGWMGWPTSWHSVVTSARARSRSRPGCGRSTAICETSITFAALRFPSSTVWRLCPYERPGASGSTGSKRSSRWLSSAPTAYWPSWAS